MFGRGRPRAARDDEQHQAPTVPRGTVASGVRAQAVAVADPDYATIERGRALRGAIGPGLTGHAGIVLDYDRGDVEHTYNRVVQPFQDPTGSIARIGMRDGIILTQPEAQDIGTTDEQLTAYQATMLARIAR